MHTRVGSITKWTSIVAVSVILIVATIYLIVFRSYEIIGENIECSSNAPLAFDYSCGLKRYDNDTQYWSLDWTIPDGIAINNLMARLTTYRQTSNSTYEITFFNNATIDVCEAIDSNMSRILLWLYLPDLNEMGNVMRSCPLMGQMYLHDFRFKRNLTLPRFLAGKWLFDVDFYFQEFDAIKVSIKFFFEVRPVS